MGPYENKKGQLNSYPSLSYLYYFKLTDRYRAAIHEAFFFTFGYSYCVNNYIHFFVSSCSGGGTRTPRPLGYEPNELTSALPRNMFLNMEKKSFLTNLYVQR